MRIAVGSLAEKFTQKMNMTFAKIITGEAQASFVYRDDLVSAFMDIEPIHTGHVLVVPNEVASSISDLNDETAARLFVVAKRIAEAIRTSSIPCDGINLFLADGKDAGQEVFHVHLHVIPRIRGDGFDIKYPDTGHFVAERASLNTVAKMITEELKV